MAGRDESVERQARNVGDVEALKRLAEKPRLRREELFYFGAFNDLDSERAHGISLARIPRSKVIDYAQECELPEAERYELVFIVQAMDAAWLNHLAEERRADAKANA